jgi:hypothetical protein
MKNDELYPEYISYLDWRLNESQISKGKYSLLKISKSSFEDFKKKLENDEYFNNKMIEIVRMESRDKKIDDIFDDID